MARERGPQDGSIMERYAKDLTELVAGLSALDPHRPFFEVQLAATYSYINRTTEAKSTLTRPLSPRQLRILGLVAAEDFTNNQIAEELYISERTVKNHVTNIFQKLEVHSKLQAVLKGLREGYLDLDKLSAGLDLDRIASLSPSEFKALASVVGSGLDGDKEIANSLGISEQTFKHEMTPVFRKLNVKGRIGAALFYLAAQKAGLVPNPQPPQETAV